jgi:hypothetical protein
VQQPLAWQVATGHRLPPLSRRGDRLSRPDVRLLRRRQASLRVTVATGARQCRPGVAGQGLGVLKPMHPRSGLDECA